VVSRNLKRFESLGWIRLARRTVEVIDEASLRVASTGSDSDPDLHDHEHAPEADSPKPYAGRSAFAPVRKNDVDWIGDFPPLDTLDDEVWRYVAGRAEVSRIPAGTRLFGPREKSDHFLLIQAGSVRVCKSFGNGREFVLYRAGRGDICCATTSVLLSGDMHLTTGVAEDDVTLVKIPARDFRQAFRDSRGFRDYVVLKYDTSTRQLLSLLNSLQAHNVEVRLARCLLGRLNHEDIVRTSHRELAIEVGTAREVVSRILKLFENKGWVSLGRRAVEVLDPEALFEVERGTDEVRSN